MSLWHRVRAWAAANRSRVESEMDAEMRFHVEAYAEDLVRGGMEKAKALRRARLDFGGVEQAKEACRDARGVRFVEGLLQDVRFGLRMLRNSPGFTAIAVLTLALGIGANTAIFSIVSAWLLRPLPLKNPQELVAVWRTRAENPNQPAYFTLYHDYLVWESHNRSFTSLGATFEQQYALTGAGEPEQIHGAVASWNFFATVGVIPAIGRLFQHQDTENEPACVISHALWARHFQSSPDVIGRVIQLNRKPYRVLGVLPKKLSLRVLDRPFETDAWTILSRDDAIYTATAASPVAVIGRLKDQVTAEQAEEDLATIQKQLDHDFSDEPPNSGVLVVNLQRDNTRTIRSSLLLVFGAVGVMLLVACVNTGSLILGRNTHRAQEFAVRAALGCGSTRLLKQLSAEGLTIFMLGGTAGVAIAFGLLRVFTAWNPFGVLPPGGVSLDVRVLAGTAAMVLAAALVFGSLPALRALVARTHAPLGGSSGRATSSEEQLRGRGLFVAMEIALCTVLLVSAGLLISTFAKINSQEVGFRTSDVLVADLTLPHATYGTNHDQTLFCEKLLERLREIPGVLASGVALTWPFNIDGLTPLETEKEQGLAMERLPRAATFEVGPGYFDALGIPLLRGRSFAEYDTPNAAPVAVINEEMARLYFAGQDPVGKHVRLRYIDQQTPREPWLAIVGVVGSTRSVRYNEIQWDQYPHIYTSFFQRPDGPRNANDPRAQTLFLYVQAKSVSGSAIAAAVRAIDPELPAGKFRTTGEIVSELRSQPSVRAIVTGAFGGLTLLLAVIGVGGVTAQMVAERRREIGIRTALGASRSEVMRLVVGHGLKLTIGGLIAGIAGALMVTRLLRSVLYGVSPFDAVTFAGVAVLITIVALATCYLPARQAMRVDPIVVLRYE